MTSFESTDNTTRNSIFAFHDLTEKVDGRPLPAPFMRELMRSIPFCHRCGEASGLDPIVNCGETDRWCEYKSLQLCLSCHASSRSLQRFKEPPTVFVGVHRPTVGAETAADVGDSSRSESSGDLDDSDGDDHDINSRDVVRSGRGVGTQNDDKAVRDAQRAWRRESAKLIPSPPYRAYGVLPAVWLHGLKASYRAHLRSYLADLSKLNAFISATFVMIHDATGREEDLELVVRLMQNAIQRFTSSMNLTTLPCILVISGDSASSGATVDDENDDTPSELEIARRILGSSRTMPQHKIINGVSVIAKVCYSPIQAATTETLVAYGALQALAELECRVEPPRIERDVDDIIIGPPRHLVPKKNRSCTIS